jgi:hypothetical protein
MAYGVEGVGKSTLGAKSDNPIFISPEGGTDQLTTVTGNPVDEIPNIKDWASLRAAVKSLISEPHDFKTAVLDSADWIEGLAHVKIIGSSGKTITTCNGGYGSGYRESQNMHQELISDLASLRDKRDMNIIVTAHAHVKPVKDPEMFHDYDSFEIKCHELVSSLWREWVDGLFFIRFRTYTKTLDDTQKARAMSDGKRVIHTVKQPAFQAKNRYGLEPEYEFTTGFWNTLIEKSKGFKETIESVNAEIADLWAVIPDQATKDLVTKTINETGNDIVRLKIIRSKLAVLTKGAHQ